MFKSLEMWRRACVAEASICAAENASIKPRFARKSCFPPADHTDVPSSPNGPTDFSMFVEWSTRVTDYMIRIFWNHPLRVRGGFGVWLVKRKAKRRDSAAKTRSTAIAGKSSAQAG